MLVYKEQDTLDAKPWTIERSDFDLFSVYYGSLYISRVLTFGEALDIISRIKTPGSGREDHISCEGSGCRWTCETCYPIL